MSPRQSPEVYRRRRLVVFGGMILVILLIGWGIWALATQLGERPDDVPQPGDSQQPSDPDDPDAENPDATGTDPTAAPCTQSNILVVPLTDATTYSAGEMPQMRIELTNTGLSDCTINVGTSTQVFTITSGSDTWWRSTDCQTEPSDTVITLKAGQILTSDTAVPWNRTRSSTSTCDSSDRPVAPAGGASYHLSVEIGGFKSAETKQIMLY